jgi:hypothetical protein
MSLDLLPLLLARLNLSPSTLADGELRRHPEQSLDALKSAGVLSPAAPASATACPDCGELRRVQIETDVIRANHGYLSCAECGVAEVDLRRLRRWTVVPEKLFVEAFRGSGASVDVSALVDERLWRIGKAPWNGASKEILFALSRRRDHDAGALTLVRKRSKAILFVSAEPDAVEWSTEVLNPIIALESVASIQGTTFNFDAGYLHSLLSATAADAAMPAKPKTKRRSARTAKIESLKRTLMEHIRAARDYGVTTRDRTGEALLLPRPTKEELAKLANVAPYDVTRCFQDEAGGDLNVLWNLADDLDRILAYRK